MRHIQSPIAIPMEEWGSIGGDVRIPGSSIKGAVRSTHEMLFGGCLRQVDLGYRPTYRQLPTMDALKDWRMAVVLDDDEVLLCEKEDPKRRSSIDSKALCERVGDRARTGDVVAVNSDDDWKDRSELRVAERFQVLQRPAEVSGYGLFRKGRTRLQLGDDGGPPRWRAVDQCVPREDEAWAGARQ